MDNKKKTNKTYYNLVMYNIILSFLIIIKKKYEHYILHAMCFRRI